MLVGHTSQVSFIVASISSHKLEQFVSISDTDGYVTEPTTLLFDQEASSFQRDQTVEERRWTLHWTYSNKSQTSFSPSNIAFELCLVYRWSSLLVVQLPIDQWAFSHLLWLLLRDSSLRYAHSGIEVHAHAFTRRRGLDIHVFRDSKIQRSRSISE